MCLGYGFLEGKTLQKITISSHCIHQTNLIPHKTVDMIQLLWVKPVVLICK